jgi:hypothetical protein
MRHANRMTAFILLLATLMLAGCVSSHGSTYRRQLSGLIRPAMAPAEDVAMAFELDRKQPHVAVTAIRDP